MKLVRFRTIVSSMSLLALASACGSPAERQLVKNLGVGISRDDARLAVEFSDRIPLSLDGEWALGCHGTLSFLPAAGEAGFRVVADLDAASFSDPNFLRERTRNLPNGAPLPPFVSGELGVWTVAKEEGYSARLYVGPGTRKYAGFGIEMSFVDRDFPSGLAVSQNLVDRSGRTIGVATLYGPKYEGERLLRSGGLFVVADLGAVSGDVAANGWHRVNAAQEVCASGWHRVNSSSGISPLGWHRVNSSSGISPLGWHRVNAVETLGWHRVNAVELRTDVDFEVTGPSEHRGLRALYRLFELFVSKGRAAGVIE